MAQVTDIRDRMTEYQAVDWLKEQGLQVSVRTIREMRARGEITYYKLPRGKHRILFTEQHLIDAFIGEEITPGRSRRSANSPARPGSRPRRPSAVDKRLASLTR